MHWLWYWQKQLQLLGYWGTVQWNIVEQSGQQVRKRSNYSVDWHSGQRSEDAQSGGQTDGPDQRGQKT